MRGRRGESVRGRALLEVANDCVDCCSLELAGGMLASTGRPGAFTLEVKLATVILGEVKALEALVEVSIGSPKEV